jgi:hypothetical protein
MPTSPFSEGFTFAVSEEHPSQGELKGGQEIIRAGPRGPKDATSASRTVHPSVTKEVRKSIVYE